MRRILALALLCVPFTSGRYDAPHEPEPFASQWDAPWPESDNGRQVSR